MKAINYQNNQRLTQCLKQYYNWLIKNIEEPVSRAIKIRPYVFKKFTTEFLELIQLVENHTRNNETMLSDLGGNKLSYLKRAILHTLHDISVDTERRSELSHNREIKERLEDEAKKIAELTKGVWFDETEAFRTPKLTDFLTIQQAEEIQRRDKSLVLAKRIYDEKFHILFAPTLFLSDVQFYRTACNLRGRPTAVAFIDIDNFKKFNDDYSYTKVDRDLLPRFMSELEAHVFSRGYAYRQGGDEYIVLLPNMTNREAANLLSQFQNRLSEVEYFEIRQGPTVSIGIIEIDEDTVLTNKECLSMAEMVKEQAKKKDKGSVFIFTKLRGDVISYEQYDNKP